MLNELIIFLIIFNLSLCLVVFPFKPAYVNKNGDIDQTKKEYNYTHFMNDYFESFPYTTIEIGNPSQKIKVILTYEDCGFKVGKAKYCVNEEEYLSHYNRNDSSDFYYTDKYIYNINEFDKGHSAADSIKLYKDMNLKKYEKFQTMDFYLGSDTNELLCGVVGFKMDRAETYCRNISVIRNFKSNNITDNYKWTLKYNSNDEGLVIFGTNMNEIIKNYNEKYLYHIESRYIGGSYYWCFDIDLLTVFGDKNMSFVGKDRWIEINNDYSFLIGNDDFENYIKDYFSEYVDKNICYKGEWQYNQYYSYYVYECDKEKFGKEDIKKFPSISFLNRKLETELVFENNELFTETKYKFFYNVIFRKTKGGYWVFGKLFFKKYQVMFDLDSDIIYIYKDNKENKNNSDSDNSSGTKLFLQIIGIIGLVCITGFLGYLLGKYLNKMRKKKANELRDDEYDYAAGEDRDDAN